MDILELDLPSHWACALFNGDTSGMEEEDIDQLDAFVEDMVGEYGKCQAISCSDDEADFRTYHDARGYGVLACVVLTFSFDITR